MQECARAQSLSCGQEQSCRAVSRQHSLTLYYKFVASWTWDRCSLLTGCAFEMSAKGCPCCPGADDETRCSILLISSFSRVPSSARIGTCSCISASSTPSLKQSAQERFLCLDKGASGRATLMCFLPARPGSRLAPRGEQTYQGLTLTAGAARDGIRAARKVQEAARGWLALLGGQQLGALFNV